VDTGDWHPHRRFSRRADNYARFRPGYPPALLNILAREIGLTAATTLADVGSGTGLFTRLLLDYGCTVYAVEPNAEMRRAAEEALGAYPRFHSIAGDAGDTTLPAASVDHVTAAQAFHWFDPVAARREFLRILRPHGAVVLVYNSWRGTDDPFASAYEALASRFAVDRDTCGARPRANDEELAAFFGSAAMGQASLPNPHYYDWDALRGRVLSSSYAPLPGHPDHEPFLDALRALFDRHAIDGRVRFPYVTRLYWGRLR
jgi:SAM-dependent methyltransferase